MEKLIKPNVELAHSVDVIKEDYWQFEKDNYPNAIYNKARNVYFSVDTTDYFDNSDLTILNNDIQDGYVIKIDGIGFSSNFSCYHDKAQHEYVAFVEKE